MNDSKNSSKGLLVLKLAMQPTREQAEALAEQIAPLAEKLGLEPLVLPEGLDVELQMGSSALLERVCVALEALVAQGQPPELSEAQIAPQALNARPTGLNSRPTAEDLLRANMERSFHEREHASLGRTIGAFSHADDQPPPTLPEEATFPVTGPIGTGLNSRPTPAEIAEAMSKGNPFTRPTTPPRPISDG